MELRKILLIVAFASMVLISVGCAGKYTGGGWIEGKCGGKATFGFQMKSDGECVSGQVQYNDHGADVMFHGVVESMNWSSGYACGTANIGPKKDPGEFHIYVEDNGEPGSMDETDYFWIILLPDCGPSYCNAGFLCGGNIQYHPAKDDN